MEPEETSTRYIGQGKVDWILSFNIESLDRPECLKQQSRDISALNLESIEEATPVMSLSQPSLGFGKRGIQVDLTTDL